MDDEEEPSREQDANLKVPATPDDIETKAEPAEDVDPALVDWLRVDAQQTVTEDHQWAGWWS